MSILLFLLDTEAPRPVPISPFGRDPRLFGMLPELLAAEELLLLLAGEDRFEELEVGLDFPQLAVEGFDLFAAAAEFLELSVADVLGVRAGMVLLGWFCRLGVGGCARRVWRCRI